MGSYGRDALAGLDRGHAERGDKVRFAGAGRTQRVHHLRAVEELERGEGQDPVAVERRLEREVEALQGLDRG